MSRGDRRSGREQARLAKAEASHARGRTSFRTPKSESSNHTDVFDAWFASQGWTPFPWQREVWAHVAAGKEGLIHAATGTGKTYAVWCGLLAKWLAAHPDLAQWPKAKDQPLRVLWITPLRALAANTEAALLKPLEDLGLPWSLERRTGDVRASVRNRQRTRLPAALITTPESLSLFLSRENAQALFAHLEAVVVDEWHELIGSKRGVQTELCLARLRRWRPELQTWGLSATLGNTDEAMAVLLGAAPRPEPVLVRGHQEKAYAVEALVPERIDRFPWAGHMGLRMLGEVLDTIANSRSTLLFTNTRSQAESWHQAIIQARPEWEKAIGLHHGSMDGEERTAVETGLQDRTLRAVVCTSSLDLGVDFAPVDRVIQLGSPKGVARLLQRAGRSGHQPGETSRITCVPTHALQLIEVAAARDALAGGNIEARRPLEKPIDVLVQHLVTLAAGGGFDADAAYEEVRTCHAYRDLQRDEFQWALDFVVYGGSSLKGHSEYHRVMPQEGRYVIRDKDIATRHRLSIGTIASDANMRVQYQRGGALGTVEENFIARLRPGDIFLFAGRTLELVRTREMTAYVRAAAGSNPALPRWMGGSLPLSGELAGAVRQVIGEAADGNIRTPEMRAMRPLLELQRDWSALPREDELLVERFKTRDGHHLVLYPFAGRLVHEGLAAVIAYRLAQLAPVSLAFSTNDYGIVWVSAQRARFTEDRAAALFSTKHLIEDIRSSLNLSELAKRQFRGIARVAGLVFTGYPWARKNARQFQASSGLFYDVFRKYDPENLLLAQAEREMLDQHFEYSRLVQTLERMQRARVLVTEPSHPTPLAFPLIVDRMRGRLSSEKLADRVARMQVQLERAAG